jgi:hypothetical protein
VNALSEAVLGPLAAPECRRLLRARWLVTGRILAIVPPALVLLWTAWMCGLYRQFGATLSTADLVRGSLLTVEGILITAGLLLGPPLLAGAFAGDELRASAGLLLACRVSSREIVVGRLAGRLSPFVGALLAAAPVLGYLGATWDMGPSRLAALLLLPAAVAFGGAGMAVGASVLSRRGRDALFAVYLVEVLLLAVPAFVTGLPTEVRDWLNPLNPYGPMTALVDSMDFGPALITSGLWVMLGVIGVALAAWRLRPAYLRESGSRGSRRFLWRRVPPVTNQPVLWKELHVESGQSLHRFVRLAVALVAFGFLGGSIALAGLMAWGAWVGPIRGWNIWAEGALRAWVGWSWPLSWLIQWTVGLRAAGTVASERERITWDALLISPLPGKEILEGKVYGSLYALRWLAAAVLLSWTIGLCSGVMEPLVYAGLLCDTLAISAFMAVAGVYCSLVSSTATKAMTRTMIAWLGAGLLTKVVAGMTAAIASVLISMLWLYTAMPASGGFPVAGPGPPVGEVFAAVYFVVRLLLYIVTALAVGFFCRRHFDRLAGRAITGRARPVRAHRAARTLSAPRSMERHQPG